MGQNTVVSRPRIAGIAAIYIFFVFLVVSFIVAEVLVLAISISQVEVVTWRIWIARLVDVGLIVLNVAALTRVTIKAAMVGTGKASWLHLESTLSRYIGLVFFGNILVWGAATMLLGLFD